MTRKIFASRDVVFLEQVEEGKDDNNNECHIPLLMEENNGDNQQQEQKEEETGDVVNKESPYKFEVEIFEVNPLP